MRCQSFLVLFHEWGPFGSQVINHHFNAGFGGYKQLLHAGKMDGYVKIQI